MHADVIQIITKDWTLHHPLCTQWRHFRPRPLTLFGKMASLVNLLGGNKWQNTAT